MKIDIPFHGSRQQVLARFYHVRPKPRRVPLTHGQNVAKQILQTVGHVIFWAALTFLFVRGMFSL